MVDLQNKGTPLHVVARSSAVLGIPSIRPCSSGVLGKSEAVREVTMASPTAL